MQAIQKSFSFNQLINFKSIDEENEIFDDFNEFLWVKSRIDEWNKNEIKMESVQFFHY